MRISILLQALQLVVLSAFVLPHTCAAFENAWPHKGSDLKPDPKVKWGKLDNGLRYAIRPHDEPPNRVAMRLFVRCGSLMEKENERGLAHFIEHMAFNGTEHYPAGKMVKYFQELGMAFGADTNAHTGYEKTVYKLQLPENDQEMLNTGLELFRDYATGMLLREEDIDDERGVILSEQRTRDTVEYRIHKAHMKFLFPDHLVAKRHPIGKERIIKNAPRERFLNFYRRWYTPSRIAVVVTGDLEVERMEKLIQRHFSSIARAEDPPPSLDLEDPFLPDKPRAGFHGEEEASETTVQIETIKPCQSPRDTRANRRKHLYRQLSHQMLSRRLEIQSKKENAPFNKGTADAFDWMDFITWGSVRLTCSPEDWKDALRTAEQTLRRALKHGFTKAELEEAKAKLLARYREEAKSASTRKSGQIADTIVRSINRNEVFTTPTYDLDFARTALEGVTPAEALSALRRTWNSENRNIFVSGNVTLKEPEQKILQTFRTSREEDVKPPEAQKTDEFAYTDFGPAGEVAEQKQNEDLDISLLTFSNNTKLNLKQTDFQENKIHISVRFGGGKLTLPENKPGLSVIASRTFTEGGLVKHSADQLERLFAGNNVEVNFNVADDAFILNGQTTPEDLKKQLQLMAAYLVAPGYREEALRQARKDLRKKYRKLKHTPQGVFQDEVLTFLASGDERFGFPPKAEMMERNLREVQRWLSSPLQRAAMSISIVGDFKKARLIELFRETFGALPERRSEKRRYEERRQVKFPRKVSEKTFTYTSEIPKSTALVCWPGPDMFNISRTRRLQILGRILSNKLRINLREKEAKTYSPGAWTNLSDTYPDYGYIAATVLTAPEHVETLASTIQQIGENLAEKGISKEELTRAKNPMLSKLEEAVRSNSYWMRSVLLKCREQPERLRWAQSMQEDIRSITQKEINELASEYLSPKRSLKILIKQNSPSQ